MDVPNGFKGFACPQAGLAQERLERIAVAHAGQLLGRLLEQHGAALEQAAPGVPALFKAWLARAPGADFDTVWHSAFGDLYAMLVLPLPADMVRSAAAAALRLNACGHAGDWEVMLPAPAALRLGPWILPAASAISVQATPRRVALCLHVAQTWRTIVFERGPGSDWATADGASLECLQPSGHPDFRFRLAPRSTLSAAAAPRLLQADDCLTQGGDARISDAWRVSCGQALKLLAATSTDYVIWVDRVLRELLPLRALPAHFHSSSEAYSPGVVCVCDHPYHWPLAEMLVRECSHQYQHLLGRLGPLDDGSDTTLHYSPFRNQLRPLAGIVAAYHAFGNVLQFYRQARAQGLLPDQNLPTDAFVQRERTLQAQLRQIEPVLLQSRALTPLGRALWQPLQQALEPQGAAA